jgi:hypothetical protein
MNGLEIGKKFKYLIDFIVMQIKQTKFLVKHNGIKRNRRSKVFGCFKGKLHGTVFDEFATQRWTAESNQISV